MMLRKIVTVVALLVMAGPLMADTDAGAVYWSRLGTHSGGSGGEFTLSKAGTSGLSNLAYDAKTSAENSNPNSFQSFCLESTEYIAGNPLDVIVSDDGSGVSKALQGGVGGLKGDPVDARTAFVYTMFAKGLLDGGVITYSGGSPTTWSPYNYTPGAARADDAVNLQKYFWTVEEEGTYADPEGYATMVAQAMDTSTGGGYSIDGGTTVQVWDGIGDVRVLNLWAYGTVGTEVIVDGYADDDLVYKKQDQLYLKPTGDLMVPLPSTLALGAVGLGLLGWFKSKRRKSVA